VRQGRPNPPSPNLLLPFSNLQFNQLPFNQLPFSNLPFSNRRADDVPLPRRRKLPRLLLRRP
jgi:hypothetical protein